MKNHGVLPSAVGEQTPHSLYDAAFGKSSQVTRPPEQLAPLAALADMNRKRAERGLPPVGNFFGKVLNNIPNA
jgi:hypothetical protein